MTTKSLTPMKNKKNVFILRHASEVPQVSQPVINLYNVYINVYIIYSTYISVEDVRFRVGTGLNVSYSALLLFWRSPDIMEGSICSPDP